MEPVTDYAAIHALIDAAEEHGFALLMRIPELTEPLLLRGSELRETWESIDMGEWVEIVGVAE